MECLKIITSEKSRRIAKFAFDYATRFGRQKVTAVHKANIMKLTDGLFLKSCEEVGFIVFLACLDFYKNIFHNKSLFSVIGGRDVSEN